MNVHGLLPPSPVARAMPLCLLCALLLFSLATGQSLASDEQPKHADARILFVDSYHQGYPWSDGIEEGIREGLDGTGVDLRVFHLDTKQKTGTEDILQAVAAALQEIESFSPDVVIACDDNAQKYLVVPHLLGTGQPVVFCGVNWDAFEYGYPAANVTGMVEVEGVEAMVNLFLLDARGPRIGYISGDTVSDRKITAEFNSRFFNGDMQVYFVKTFAEFKSTFLRAQDEVDMLFLRNYAGIQDWDPVEAKAFLLENCAVPTGSHLDFMAEFVVYTMGKVAQEQGVWAADTALRILDGAPPGDIPLAENEKVRLVVNLPMAEAAGIVVPMSILRTAEVLGME